MNGGSCSQTCVDHRDNSSVGISERVSRVIYFFVTLLVGEDRKDANYNFVVFLQQLIHLCVGLMNSY